MTPGWLMVALVLLVSCAGEQPAEVPAEVPADTAGALQAGTSPSEAAPETVSEVGHDPHALIRTVQEVIKGVDARLGELEQRERKEAPEKPGWDPRTLHLWLADGEPVKLIATEPTDAGKMTGRSAYYYQNGRLLFVQHPYAGYVFDEGKIVLWVNEAMKPVDDVPARDVTQRQEHVKAESQHYLSLFGVEQADS